MKTPTRHAEKVDILLLLEGTYPYVQGGVSSWISQIIQAYPDYDFGIIFLGSRPEDYDKVHYTFPDNLKHFEAHYLFSGHPLPPIQPQVGNKAGFKCVEHIHEWFRAPNSTPYEKRIEDLEFFLDPEHGVDYNQFLYSKLSWEQITTNYEERCTDPSFIHYFWAIRNMHAPIWVLADIAKNAPEAGAYHSASTGYAGFLGALLHNQFKRPLILSEHGIYSKERKIDLLQTHVLRDETNELLQSNFDIDYIQNVWITFFNALGQFCYRAANPIVSLFQTARKRQIIDGADPARTKTIANGVNIPLFKAGRRPIDTPPPPVIALIGRVVPIKDIKTFIRAVRIIENHIPSLKAWIVGPTEEDPSYFEECKNLVSSLNLNERIEFLGIQKTPEILSKIGICVLSSISEGLPLVILEAYAAGIPCVATDVGACRELVIGDTADDQAIGPSGRVVSIANPKAIADASIELLQPEHWHRASKAAITRVERYYSQQTMFSHYSKIYEEALHGGDRV